MLPSGVGDDDRDVGAERKHRRMRDVQDAQQAVDKGQADRHHGVHAAEDQAGDGKVDVIHEELPKAAALPLPACGERSVAQRSG